MQRTGHCLCGAVSFVAELGAPKLSACHCGMCLRWSGGPFMGIGVRSITWEGEDAIRTFESSKIAERGFCSICGSSLFYRVTMPGPHQGYTSVAFGALDDKAGLELGMEWFFDRKPEAYDFGGERRRVSEAEALAMLGE